MFTVVNGATYQYPNRQGTQTDEKIFYKIYYKMQRIKKKTLSEIHKTDLPFIKINEMMRNEIGKKQALPKNNQILYRYETRANGLNG